MRPGKISHPPAGSVSRGAFGWRPAEVSLIRALMLKPDLLLLDEPMGALDPMVRASLLRDLKALFERLNETVILVTHDLVEAARLGDWVVLLKARKNHPARSFCRTFLYVRPILFVSEFFHAQMEGAHS